MKPSPRPPRPLESAPRRRTGERPDDGNAFLPDTVNQNRPLPPTDGDSFAEEFMSAATAGESVSQAAEDEVSDEEEGGPFIVLEEDGSLPSEPAEASPDDEPPEPIEQEQLTRGANWAAKGV